MDLVYGFVQTGTLHNARIGLFPKILYPYHPLFGKECEAFGAAGGARDMVYVRLADRSTKGVPAWMFDPEERSQEKIHDKWRVSADLRRQAWETLDGVPIWSCWAIHASGTAVRRRICAAMSTFTG